MTPDRSPITQPLPPSSALRPPSSDHRPPITAFPLEPTRQLLILLAMLPKVVSPSESRGRGWPRPRRELPACVREALVALGQRYAREGIRVFLFGSVARTWPQALMGADLDIGYELPPGTLDPGRVRRRLEDDLAALPSIRPVDLVDFTTAPESFRAVASQCIVDLAHVSRLPATR